MRLIVAVLVAGCSFEHGVVSDSGGAGGAPDGAVAADASPASDATDLVPEPDAPPPCADDDSDGVCNTVDDWPCGAKPTEPAATVTFTINNAATETTITTVNVDGTGRLAVGSSQEMLSLAFDFAIDDKACSSACVDQVEVGWVPGGRAGCVFDDVVPKQTGASGPVSVQIRAPQAKGSYDLRVNLGQNYSCTYGGANNWWGGTPPASRTIAKLCVH